VLDNLTRATVKAKGATWSPRHAVFNEVFYEHMLGNWGVELDLDVLSDLRARRAHLARRLFILLESHRLFGTAGQKKRTYSEYVDQELRARLMISDKRDDRIAKRVSAAGELICSLCPERYQTIGIRTSTAAGKPKYKLVVERTELSRQERRAIAAGKAAVLG